MKASVKKGFVCLALAALAGAGIFAFDAKDIVKSDLYDKLVSTGKIEKRYYMQNNVEMALVPDTELARNTVGFWAGNEAVQPVFIAETLYYLKKSELGDGDESKTNIDYVSKVVRSVSKMKGMQYYSTGDKKWETLYKECHCIKGPTDRTFVDDDLEGSADGKVMYCMQDDNSYGKTNYRLEYHQNAEEVSANFITTTAMWVGPIKAISEGNLRNNITIIDCGDSFVVYMLIRANFPAMSILEQKMNDSFGSRMDAIYNWFVSQF